MQTDPKRLALVLAVAAFPLLSCGGDDGTSGETGTTGGTGEDVVVTALDSLEFDRDNYTTEAGEVTFYYEGGQIQHSLLVEGYEDEMRLVIQGDEAEGSLELPAGEYRMYCDIAGHEAAGMEATLIVE